MCGGGGEGGCGGAQKSGCTALWRAHTHPPTHPRTQWCGTLTKTFGHRATAPIKTFIDQGIHHPFIYFPAFFSMKALVSGKPLSSAGE